MNERFTWKRHGGYSRRSKRVRWFVSEESCYWACWGDGNTRDKALLELTEFHNWSVTGVIESQRSRQILPLAARGGMK